MIINITDSAKNELNTSFKNLNLNDKYLRVYIKRISAWYGPIFNIALDEPTEDDVIFSYEDFKIVINSDLASKINIVNIFYKSPLYGDKFRVSTDLVWKEEYYDAPWSKPW